MFAKQTFVSRKCVDNTKFRYRREYIVAIIFLLKRYSVVVLLALCHELCELNNPFLKIILFTRIALVSIYCTIYHCLSVYSLAFSPFTGLYFDFSLSLYFFIFPTLCLFTCVSFFLLQAFYSICHIDCLFIYVYFFCITLCINQCKYFMLILVVFINSHVLFHKKLI